MKATLSAIENGWSDGTSFLLDWITGRVPPVFGWILSLLVLSVAGSITLVYLILKLFIPRKFRP